MNRGHYVCDQCGAYWTNPYPLHPSYRCIHCGGANHSQFTRSIAALEHGAHVRERRGASLEAVSNNLEVTLAQAPRHNGASTTHGVRSNEHGSSKT